MFPCFSLWALDSFLVGGLTVFLACAFVHVHSVRARSTGFLDRIVVRNTPGPTFFKTARASP